MIDHLIAGHGAEIRGLRFCVASSDAIDRSAVVEVSSQSIYTRGIPVAKSVNDLRMGSTDRRLRCTTCWNNMIACTGHCGQIVLPTAIYHGAYVDMVLKILRTVCHVCARPRAQIAPALDHRGGKFQFAACYQLCRGKKMCEPRI